MKHAGLAAVLAALVSLAGAAGADEVRVIKAKVEMPATTALPQVVRGPVTSLPIPRFVSMKAHEANVRRGPSLSHRIDWIYKRKDLPLMITAEHGHWRRVEDVDGAGGWVHYAMLSGVRTVIVRQDDVPMRMKPSPDAPINALAERQVVARLAECLQDWCRIRTGGYRGWVPKTALWGVEQDDPRD